MNEKKLKKLFFQLFNAKNEEQLTEIILNNKILNDNDNWKPYGGDIKNFSTFESQQNNPIPALVEKITNSVDASLMKKCLENGINPESGEAPRSMYEAVEKFYKIDNGNLNDLTNEKRRLIAEDIQVIAVGNKGQPNIRIYDNGEGQLPERFEHTLLSLHKGNKIKIPFAQGKYNMGSTGAVVYCGDKKYQLIGSKRAHNDGANFGFTLVRKHFLTDAEKKEGYRATWYEYLTIREEIPSFQISTLDLGLKNRDFITGTIIQLYSYHLPHGNKGSISTDLYRTFNHYFYGLPLPFIVYETRYKSKPNNKVIKGNRNRIDEDSHKNVEKYISLELRTNLDQDIEIFKVPIEVTVFKEQEANEQNRQFIGNKNLIFTLNGQIHGFEGQTFISKSLGFPLLKNSTLVAINCNYLPIEVMPELFMSNRTHLKEGKFTEQLKKEIIALIKQDKTLRQVNERRKESLIGKSDSKEFGSAIGLLPKSSEIFDFLKKDSKLPFSKVRKKEQGNSSRSSEKSERKDLNRFPSKFKLKLDKNSEGKRVKTLPINQQGHVTIKTDVQDDYLFRSSDTGKLDVEILQKTSETESSSDGGSQAGKVPSQKVKVNVAGPSNGNIKLSIKPTQDARVGDEVEVRVNLTSPEKDFTCIFDVRVDKEIAPPKKVSKKKTNHYPSPPPGRKAYKNPENKDDLAWNNSSLNWDGNDVVKVLSQGEESELLVDGIVINMDSYVLQDFIRKNNYTNAKDITRISEKYFKLIYTHSLGLYSICTKMQQDKKDNQDEINDFEISQVDEFVSSLTKSYASFLLYMDLHNEEIIKQMNDDD